MSRRTRYNAGATAALPQKGQSAYEAIAALWNKITSNSPKTHRLKAHELTFILSTLSTLVSNGVSLPKALATLAREHSLAKHKNLLDTLRRSVESGVTFSQSLSQFPELNDPLVISQIQLGERSGQLADSLEHLSKNRGRSAELRRTIIKKLAYPGLLISLGSCLLMFLLAYVVPVFEETYQKAGVPLPFITQALITVSQWIKWYGWILLLIIGVAVTLGYQLRKRKEVALMMDRAILRLPFCGNWLRDIAVLQLMEVLNSLMSAGYTLAEAVRETANSVSNRAVKEGVHNLQLAIQHGERFSRELERQEDLFPPIVNQLVIVGESTGQLTRATNDICEFLRGEIERKTSLMVGALEPVLTIGLATAIAIVLLAIYLPMFDMVNAISG